MYENRNNIGILIFHRTNTLESFQCSKNGLNIYPITSIIKNATIEQWNFSPE